MSDQLSLLDPPSVEEVAQAVARQTAGQTHHGAPVTSLASAAKVKTGTQRHRALSVLVRQGPATGHEVAAALGHPLPHVYTTRLEELEQVRCVERTTDTRPTWSGQEALVWAITEFGRAVEAELS